MQTAIIDTNSGKQIDVFNPNINDICINDIAHALSNLCRYGGHSPEFFSVAEHCLNCISQYDCEYFKLELFMHDSPEYLLVDVPSPIKRSENFGEYNLIEQRLLGLICFKFRIHENYLNHYKQIREIDLHIRKTEMDYFMKYKSMSWTRKQLEKLNPNRPVKFLKPHVAKKRFLKKFNELINNVL